jgi:hypothetical protein
MEKGQGTTSNKTTDETTKGVNELRTSTTWLPTNERTTEAELVHVLVIENIRACQSKIKQQQR